MTGSESASATRGLAVYLVGGAIRDRLLGWPVRERDYVVVGSSADELLARGFRQVGRDFPVFLHPETQDEYALARTERKTAPGYRGFAVHADPSVTLADDLRRRDLTINALAEDAMGRLIDPYGGLDDLRARILRHVSPAFAEDPVRILRVARFAARLAPRGFRIADETWALMRAMADAGEVDALVPERVWQELSRALLESRPAVAFETLRACGALARLLPELDRLWGIPQPERWHPEIDTGVHVMLVLDQAARLSPELDVRFAALCHDLGKGTTPPAQWPSHKGHEERSVALLDAICDRFRIPGTSRALARIVARWHGLMHKVDELRAATILRLFESADAIRRPERFHRAILACEADFRGRAGYAERDYPQGVLLRQLLTAVRAVETAAIVRDAPTPARIPARIRAARILAIRSARRAASDAA